DPVPAKAAGLEHPARRELVLGILEDASEGPLVRRLRRLPPCLHVADDGLDLLERARVELELDARNDLAVRERGVAVREVELRPAQPLGTIRADDKRADEDLCPVTA